MSNKLSLTLELIAGTLSGELLFNNNDKIPIKIWSRGSSWGDATLSFQIDTVGGPVNVFLKPQVYSVNYPFTTTIDAGQSFKVPFDLKDRQWVNGGPMSPEMRSLTAIYEVLKTPQSVKSNVWTGLLTASSPL